MNKKTHLWNIRESVETAPHYEFMMKVTVQREKDDKKKKTQQYNGTL